MAQVSLNASGVVTFKMPNTQGLKVQAIIISVDAGNLRFKKMSFIDLVHLKEIGTTGTFTENDFMTIENQKEIFYMGGNELAKDIEFEVAEVDAVVTVFQITVVPDNDFANLFSRMRMFFVGKSKDSAFSPAEPGPL